MNRQLHILVVDWSKEIRKRVAYRVELAQRSVISLTPPSGGWTVNGLVDAASGLGGPVLVLIDVAIGLPLNLFKAMRDSCRRTEIGNFLEFLRADPPGEWLGDVRSHVNWNARTPYIHVPKGDGSLTGFKNKAAESGVCLCRAIDLETRGRSPLILSGIPGTVGSGSRDVIGSLGGLDAKKTAVWPFDGPLDVLLASGRIVLGEIYPRALYGHVLLDDSPDERCLYPVAKTKRPNRNAAVARLESLYWHRRLDIALEPDLIQRARGNEDDFDAFFSALGILRLFLENISLEDDSLRSRTSDQGLPLLDTIAEGGMLGVLASQLDRGQRTFVAPASANSSDSKGPGRVKPQVARKPRRPSGPWVRVTGAIIENAKQHLNNRQISFSGVLTSDDKNPPAWVEIECEGRPYKLTIGDTTTWFRSHQVSTAEDFDALYALLSRTPDQHIPIALVKVRPPVGENFAANNDA